MRELLADSTVDAQARGRNTTLHALRQPVSPFPDRIQEALRTRVFEASRGTLERLVGDVMDDLAQASADGLGIHDAAARLEETFDSMREFELRRIARTEINRAQQDAAMTTMTENGVRYHEWVTASDERVRSSHAAQHGEIVSLGKPFSNGLVRPGDPNGPPSEFVNCRCRIAPFLVPHGKMFPPDRAQYYASDLMSIA